MLYLAIQFCTRHNRESGFTDDLAELWVGSLFADVRPLNDHGQVTVQKGIFQFLVPVAEHVRGTKLECIRHVLQTGDGDFGVDLRIHVIIEINASAARKTS